jgi:hypothetical protein
MRLPASLCHVARAHVCKSHVYYKYYTITYVVICVPLITVFTCSARKPATITVVALCHKTLDTPSLQGSRKSARGLRMAGVTAGIRNWHLPNRIRTIIGCTNSLGKTLSWYMCWVFMKTSFWNPYLVLSIDLVLSGMLSDQNWFIRPQKLN